MVYRIDLRLGEVVYVLVFYNLSVSWLLSLNGFKFIVLCFDSENDLYQKAVEVLRSTSQRTHDERDDITCALCSLTFANGYLP